jgi:hypothetical protein
VSTLRDLEHDLKIQSKILVNLEDEVSKAGQIHRPLDYAKLLDAYNTTRASVAELKQQISFAAADERKAGGLLASAMHEAFLSAMAELVEAKTISGPVFAEIWTALERHRFFPKDTDPDQILTQRTEDERWIESLPVDSPDEWDMLVEEGFFDPKTIPAA